MVSASRACSPMTSSMKAGCTPLRGPRRLVRVAGASTSSRRRGSSTSSRRGAASSTGPRPPLLDDPVAGMSSSTARPREEELRPAALAYWSDSLMMARQ